ncbi:ABC transporter permease [Botryobacter ruber]|uniref:ABC transporter permease n=1 Tax=Botryobacter ruber TaxID=2171629 RepID=UPI000E0A7673|nr:ABC transporter permease [Botryobacter ruber]
MFFFLLKRLLLALPSLWLIATLIFLLSRLLPGTFGAENILKESGDFYSTGTAAARKAAYASFLHKTYQDLPLFYFSIQAAAEAGTPAANLPEQERKLLKKLSWHYGNEEAVAAYVNCIKELRQELHIRDNAGHLANIEKLYTVTEPEALLATVKETVSNMGNTAPSLTSKLQTSAATLVRRQQPYRAFLPAIYWHGTQNQYHQWLTKLLQGNLGNSFRDNRSVFTILKEAIQATILLLLASMLLTTLLALELGIFLQKQSGRRWRRIILPFLFFTDRIPVFLLALLLLLLFASPDYFQLFPVYGLGYYTGAEENLLQRILFMAPYLVLPIICLVFVNLPYLTNQFYRTMADISHTEYIKTAKAKGLAEGTIIRRHILRNALLPIITLLSDFIPALVAGAVVIETVFAIPGMGSLLVQAVQARDYPVMVGIVLVVALAKIISHLVADFFYTLADPRLRLTAS